MTKRKILLAVITVLAGCHMGKSDPVDDNNGYGYRTDDVGPAGLRLQWRRTDVPYRDAAGKPYTGGLLQGGNNPPTWIAWLERDFAVTKACTGIDGPPPFVVVIPQGALAPHGGLTHSRPPFTILIDALQTAKHEYVHYLLSVSGFPQADNNAHNSPLFQKCQQ